MTNLETDIVLSAIRRGEDSLPKLRAATGLEYAQLHVVLHTLEFEWRSIDSIETTDGFQRFIPKASEKSNGGPKISQERPAPITPQATKDTKASVSARDATLFQRDAPYCIKCRSLCLFDGMDTESRPHWRCRTCDLTFEGSSQQVVEMAHIDPYKEAEAKIAAIVERGRAKQVDPKPKERVSARRKNPQNNGRPRVKIDLQLLEDSIARRDITINEAFRTAGVRRNTVYTRKKTDPEVAAALDRGLARRMGNLPAEKETEDSPSQIEQAKALPEDLQESRETITEIITDSSQLPENRKNVQLCYSPVDSLEALAKERDIIPELSSQDTHMVTRQTEIHGSLVLREEVQLKVEEIAQWPAERIAEFFDAISKVVNIPARTIPTKIKRAWSKSFEDDTEEGLPALTMLYLVSMLHEGMEEHEKQAVWTLILHLKRVQAAAEEAREAKKGEQK